MNGSELSVLKEGIERLHRGMEVVKIVELEPRLSEADGLPVPVVVGIANRCNEREAIHATPKKEGHNNTPTRLTLGGEPHLGEC